MSLKEKIKNFSLPYSERDIDYLKKRRKTKYRCVWFLFCLFSLSWILGFYFLFFYMDMLNLILVRGSNFDIVLIMLGFTTAFVMFVWININLLIMYTDLSNDYNFVDLFIYLKRMNYEFEKQEGKK